MIDAAAKDEHLVRGQPCFRGSARTTWQAGGRAGELLCFSHGRSARIIYDEPSLGAVVELRRQGTIRDLSRWWQRHRVPLVEAAVR